MGKKQVPFILIRRGKFHRIVFYQLMDEDNLNCLIQRCLELKYKFRGVYVVDNFPTNLTDNSFIIVNISTSASFGTHWILLCQKRQELFYSDPLGQTISSYKHLQCRIASNFNVNTVFELLRNQPIQKQNSILCGLFCIYIAHIIFSGQKLVKMSDIDLLRFALHMMF